MTAQVIATGRGHHHPGILTRILEVLSRLEESLDLARELRRRSPEDARHLLIERGLIAR
ncbi:MAG TPA: hypothetical protein VH743_17815 [Beijerinckiaceae bacterium]|jgi:hypothetical protein